MRPRRLLRAAAKVFWRPEPLFFGLWLATFVSAALSQLPLAEHEELLRVPALLWQAPNRAFGPILFAAGLMAILTGHELGHLIAARAYGVVCGWPLFLPAPTLFGTLGAVMPMRSPAPTRGALVRIAVMGPLFGFALAAPMYVLGQRLDAGAGAPWQVGPSLMTWGLLKAFGQEAGNQNLTPVALAGWLGLFHTGVNLVPLGQLDGGHVLYAIAGRHYRSCCAAVTALLVAGGMAGRVWPMSPSIWPSCAVWPLLALLQWAWGIAHDGAEDDSVPLGRLDRALCVLAGVLGLCTWVCGPIMGM